MRVCACVLSGSKDALAPVIRAWHESNTIAVIASFLPPATANARGAITAESVVMPPQSGRTSGKLAGNAVKCLVSVMDDPAGPAAQRLIQASAGGGLLERLVALLANTQDMAVRKNVAIVLAKAMRHEPSKNRVRELRGIEMLVQLGPSLK